MPSFSSLRHSLLSIFFVAALLAPAPLLAQARPSISDVAPATVTAGVTTSLSARVATGSGINFCDLYFDLEDVGSMTISNGVASLPYTVTSGGSHIAFVYCHYLDGSINSGNETAIWANGTITNSAPFSGGGSSDTHQNDTNTTSMPTPSNMPPAPSASSSQTSGTLTNEVETPVPGVSFGSLIKLNCVDGASPTDECHAVYYYGADGKRHAFANSAVFFTWYGDFNSVMTVDLTILSSIPLGKNVTYRPGVRMLKFTTDPRVYAVSKGGLLRWIANEEVATSLYGAAWNTKIDDLSDTLYGNYQFGAAITSTGGYDPVSETSATTKIDESL